jgi:hypothetical protein
VDSKQVSQLTTGLLVVLVGSILLSGQLHVGADFGRLWPLFLLVIGVSQFMRVNDDGTHGNGTWFLFLGAVFLLNNYRILRFSDSWPLFIVAVGLGIMFGRKDRGGRRRRRNRDRVAVDQPGQAGNGSVQS